MRPLRRLLRVARWVPLLLVAWAPAADGASILNLREGAATPQVAARLKAVNDWWQAQNPGLIPCRKCEIRPPGSALLWTYYRRQGFFPNWVGAARDLLRRAREGEVEGVRAGVDEIVSHSLVRTSPGGIRYRINESPFLSTDSTAPPWRDAMGQGLILTAVVEALPPDATAARRARARRLAAEYLGSFAVSWRDGGVATDGKAGGSWYLEYATERGDRSRVLNGFMQTLVSLDRFARGADRLAATDPAWAALASRAREHVRLGALEVHAQLDSYDLGNGLGRYSLRTADPAPAVYQTYHRQLLLRLQGIEYLPQEWRDHFDAVRVAWGGDDLSPGLRWWGWLLIAAGAILLVLGALRVRAVGRQRRRAVPVAEGRR